MWIQGIVATGFTQYRAYSTDEVIFSFPIYWLFAWFIQLNKSIIGFLWVVAGNGLAPTGKPNPNY